MLGARDFFSQQATFKPNLNEQMTSNFRFFLLKMIDKVEKDLNQQTLLDFINN